MQKLIVCCDGTWNDTVDNTNICRIAAAARTIVGERFVFYDPGVGAGAVGKLEWLAGGITGYGISRNIVEAYGWLADTYQEKKDNRSKDDEIFVFGFSRGAFAARSLVGFLRFNGLLARRDRSKVEEAYWHYRATRIARSPQSAKDAAEEYARGPTRARSREVRVRFLGVFDTVGALGIPLSLAEKARNRLIWHTDARFHDTGLSSIVDTARQALAIDEQRPNYQPALWTTKPGDPQRDVEQAWFPGVHSDVGGGYGDDRGLGDLSLQWMAQEAGKCGLDLWPELVRRGEARPDPGARLHNSLTAIWRAASMASGREPGPRAIGDGMRQLDGVRTPGEHVDTSAPRRAELTEYRPASLTLEGGMARDPRGYPLKVRGPVYS